MKAAFFLALTRSGQLIWWAVQALPAAGWRYLPKRLLLFGLGLPLFFLLQGLHWLGFLLDELLFPAYRRVRIDRPLFIVGIPRSGTTFLQRTLAAEPALTTTRTWECLLAPSITERYLGRGLGLLLRPFSHLSQRLAPSFFHKMEAIHPLGLDEPEEDFLLLLPIFSSFILISLFPESKTLWRLAAFDRDVPPREQEIILDFYRRCVQKHLYFHGPERRYLSKNPSFSSLLGGLAARFPDARFVVCVRSPHKTVPSQLSSLRPAFSLLAGGELPPTFQTRMIDMLHHYYALFSRELPQIAPDTPIVPMENLKTALRPTLEQVFTHAGLSMSPRFESSLSTTSQASNTYKSQHRYDVNEFGLQPAAIEARFADVWPLSLSKESRVPAAQAAAPSRRI